MKDTDFLAPKYKRLFAYLIDVAIFAIPITIIYNIGLGGVLPQLITIVSYWLYFAIMESSKNQGTVGKLILKIKVVDQQGEAITFGKATLRHLGRILSMLTFLIGFIIIFFTKKQQCLHDLIAKTLVINKSACKETTSTFPCIYKEFFYCSRYLWVTRCSGYFSTLYHGGQANELN